MSDEDQNKIGVSSVPTENPHAVKRHQKAVAKLLKKSSKP